MTERPLRLDPEPVWTVAAGIIILALAGVSYVGLRPDNDIGAFLKGASHFLAHGTPYPPPDVILATGDFAYPPLVAWLLTPLAPLPLDVAARIWFCVHLVALGVFAHLVGRLTDSAPGWRSGVLWAGVLSANLSQIQGVAIGQWQDVIGAMLAGAVWLAWRGRDGAAGALLGLATAIKLFPAALLLPFVAERRWRAVASFAAVGVGVALLGPAQHLTYVRDYLVGGRVPLPLASQHVMSWPAVAMRLFRVTDHSHPWFVSPVAESAMVVSGTLLLVLTVALAKGRMRWVAGLLATSALAPGVGVYHASLPLLAIAVAASGPSTGGWWTIQRPRWLLLAVPFVIPIEWGLTGRAPAAVMWLHTDFGNLFQSPQAIGLFVAVSAVLIDALDKKNRTELSTLP